MFRACSCRHISCDGGSRGAGTRKSDLGQTKIENLGVAAFGYKDVGRFDVAMDDSFRVGGFESVGDLNREREKIIGVERFAADAVLQRHAIEIFHHDERLTVLLANFVNRADIRMIQSRGSASFATKAFQRLWVAYDVVGKEFQRDEAT